MNTSPSTSTSTRVEERRLSTVSTTSSTHALHNDPAAVGGKHADKRRCRKCCFSTLFVLGLLSAVLGVAMLAGGYDAIFNAVLKTQMQVKEGSTSYDIWKDTPVPLSISFYLYNITNPEEFEKGSVPVLNEVGPYVYKEYHQKTNITFHPNATVTFYQNRWWMWDEGASGNLTQSDVFWILNTVPVSAAYAVEDNDVLLSGLNEVLVLLHEELMMAVNVSEILFEGYHDALLTFVQNNVDALPDWVVSNLPAQLLDYNKMGWFYNRNLSETYDGLFNMHTGEDNLDNLGMMDWWNYDRTTGFFHYPCNVVSGSAGELWPPNQAKTNISFYNSDLCMTISLQYKGRVTDPNGLDVYRYWGDDTVFASAEERPAHLCYCYTNDTCPPQGLLDAQTCRMGAPAFISFPHFLHGDPILWESVEGMKLPDEDRDQMLIDMIPELGVPVSVRARMQINIAVKPYPGNALHLGRIDILAKVREVILPVIWFEVSADLTEDLARELRPVLFLIRTPTITVVWGVMTGLGAITVLALTVKRCT